MTTVVPHPADVTVPCTSNSGNVAPNGVSNAGSFRSSPFLDSNKQPLLPLTTQPTTGVPAASSVFVSNANGGRPASNAQMPPYHHNHFRQQQEPAAVSQLVAVRGKTDPAMAPYMCAKCNKKIVDRYLLEALEKYWHEDCLKVRVTTALISAIRVQRPDLDLSCTCPFSV